MDEEAFRLAIIRIGVYFRPKQFKNVCNRNLLLRDEITKITGKTCENVTEVDLSSIKTLSIAGNAVNSALNLGFLELSDFAGFSSLKDLRLSNLGLDHLFEHQIATSSKLHSINFDDNNFTEVPRQQLSGFGKLNSLSMKNNRLSKHGHCRSEIPLFLNHEIILGNLIYSYIKWHKNC